MKSVKVFYLVYGLTSGGIERYSVNLYKYIDKSNLQLDFIVKTNEKEFFDDIFEAAGGKKIAIADGNKGKLFYLLNVCKIAKSGYDVAYFNLSSPSAVFKYPLICRLAGIKKIIIHSHNSHEDKINFLKGFVNWLGRRYINKICTVKFACSDRAAVWMFGKNNSHNYVLINNGIEVDKYSYNETIRDKYRIELGCDKNTLVIGHVGRFVRQKNHAFLIEIFNELIKIRPNSRLLLIGTGPLKGKIEAIVKNKNIEMNVIFAGEKSNVNDYMQAMDMFILPSLYEGLPIAGIEAQASGLRCFFF